MLDMRAQLQPLRTHRLGNAEVDHTPAVCQLGRLPGMPDHLIAGGEDGPCPVSQYVAPCPAPRLRLQPAVLLEPEDRCPHARGVETGKSHQVYGACDGHPLSHRAHDSTEEADQDRARTAGT